MSFSLSVCKSVMMMIDDQHLREMKKYEENSGWHTAREENLPQYYFRYQNISH